MSSTASATLSRRPRLAPPSATTGGGGRHPGIEMALVELTRVTGDGRYLALAARMLDLRGRGGGRRARRRGPVGRRGAALARPGADPDLPDRRDGQPAPRRVLRRSLRLLPAQPDADAQRPGAVPGDQRRHRGPAPPVRHRRPPRPGPGGEARLAIRTGYPWHGYAELSRPWRAGDTTVLDLELPVRVTEPDPRVDAGRGPAAGPRRGRRRGRGARGPRARRRPGAGRRRRGRPVGRGRPVLRLGQPAGRGDAVSIPR